MSIKAGIAPFNLEPSPRTTVSSVFNGAASSLINILTIFGTIIAVGMVIYVVSLLAARRLSEQVDQVSKAEDKVAIQEYYQTHGVRPASKAEADLLEVENRRKENERRALEREKERAEEESARFEQESRRIGERVSDNLRNAESQTRYEEEQKKRQLDYEKHAKEEAERNRIEREKERWRDVLNSPGPR
jgi:flagellar biosynthesis GTPase FlhF